MATGLHPLGGMGAVDPLKTCHVLPQVNWAKVDSAMSLSNGGKILGI